MSALGTREREAYSGVAFSPHPQRHPDPVWTFCQEGGIMLETIHLLSQNVDGF